MDVYEEQYMSGDGEVLFREKQITPGWMKAIVVLSILFGTGALIATAISAGSILPALMAPFYIGLLVFF